MTRMAFSAIRGLQETMASLPNEARDLVATLFDRITFTPIETPDGPRYQLEGTGEIGRFLGIEQEAKCVSPGGIHPLAFGRVLEKPVMRVAA